MWDNFEFFALATLVLWLSSAVIALFGKSKRTVLASQLLLLLGILSLLTFILMLWLKLERPPMRTLGETRLWYSFFLAIIGLFIYQRWKYKWLVIYSTTMASLFLVINFIHPETHSKALMPALQSAWFVPHVIVYMLAYAFLAMSCLLGFWGLYCIFKKQLKSNIIELTDNMVFIGFGFLTLGLIFGALWAKEAWGHYWTWDPKEVWAFLTWNVYLIYIHLRNENKKTIKTTLVYLSIAFILLLICWFGLNYLPIAKYSVHTYVNG